MKALPLNFYVQVRGVEIDEGKDRGSNRRGARKDIVRPLSHPLSKYEITPIVAEVPTKEDALSLYRRLKAISPASCIFEAGGSGEARGRYAHIGLAPQKLFVAEKGKDFLKEVEAYLKERRSENAKFPFAGGVAGYFGYEMAGQWERLFHDEPSRELKHNLTPPAMLMEPSVMVVVDSLLQKTTIVANVPVEEGD